MARNTLVCTFEDLTRKLARFDEVYGSLDDYVRDYLGKRASRYDVDGVLRQFRKELNDFLDDSKVTLTHNDRFMCAMRRFYGPEVYGAIGDAFDAVDLQGIVRLYARRSGRRLRRMVWTLIIVVVIVCGVAVVMSQR